jgi:hypothetical protein
MPEADKESNLLQLSPPIGATPPLLPELLIGMLGISPLVFSAVGVADLDINSS